MRRAFAVGLSAALGAFAAAPAPAAYLIELEETPFGVVATGSGSLNLEALTYLGYSPGEAGAQIEGRVARLAVGHGSVAEYSGLVGPSSFGNGLWRFADYSSGWLVGLNGSNGAIGVSPYYVSGTDLGVSTARFLVQDFSILGLTPGEYAWTWGEGASADSLTVRIGRGAPVTGVPEPAVWATILLGFGLAGAALRSPRRRTQTVAPT